MNAIQKEGPKAAGTLSNPVSWNNAIQMELAELLDQNHPKVSR